PALVEQHAHARVDLVRGAHQTSDRPEREQPFPLAPLSAPLLATEALLESVDLGGQVEEWLHAQIMRGGSQVTLAVQQRTRQHGSRGQALDAPDVPFPASF